MYQSLFSVESKAKLALVLCNEDSVVKRKLAHAGVQNVITLINWWVLIKTKLFSPAAIDAVI